MITYVIRTQNNSTVQVDVVINIPKIHTLNLLYNRITNSI